MASRAQVSMSGQTTFNPRHRVASAANRTARRKATASRSSRLPPGSRAWPVRHRAVLGPTAKVHAPLPAPTPPAPEARAQAKTSRIYRTKLWGVLSWSEIVIVGALAGRSRALLLYLFGRQEAISKSGAVGAGLGLGGVYPSQR